MRILTAVSCAVALSASTSTAQEMGAYFTTIDPQDTRNSSGAPLSSFGQMLQQDRANFHRFGRAGLDDHNDPFFGDRARRAQIPQLFANGPDGTYWEGSGVGTQVRVFICGSGGRIAYIAVDHADGDGYRGCRK